MIRIEPDHWLPAEYARAFDLTDMLRHPMDDYGSMSPADQDRLRQSQVEKDEIFRVLGFHERHALIMKYDDVLGWVPREAIRIDRQVHDFEPAPFRQLSVCEFFKYWQGTRYIWGGVTKEGIDCSGLTQRFFHDVLGRIIPKNTYNQRRAGTSKALGEIANHDLVFCTRIGGRGIHHVGIFADGDIWHAHGERGVIRQTLTEFLTQYQVLEIVQLT